MNRVYSRLEPESFEHIEKYPYSALCTGSKFVLEKELILPHWINEHDQKSQGACVGFSTVLGMSILNDDQCRRQGAVNPVCRYNPWWVWNEAKKIDEFHTTKPGDNNGTTVKAAMEVVRENGLVIWDGQNEDFASNHNSDFSSFLYSDAGISSTRWARTVDEVREALYNGKPVIVGINWYKGFDVPEVFNDEYWIGRDKIGRLSGGHAVVIAGGSDQREAFRIVNSWGLEWPPSWMHYDIFDKLLRENGEAALVTDK